MLDNEDEELVNLCRLYEKGTMLFYFSFNIWILKPLLHVPLRLFYFTLLFYVQLLQLVLNTCLKLCFISIFRLFLIQRKSLFETILFSLFSPLPWKNRSLFRKRLKSNWNEHSNCFTAKVLIFNLNPCRL